MLHAQKLLGMIEARGWAGRIVPISHLHQLRDAVLGRYEQGLFDEGVYQSRYSSFSFDPPPDLPGARSMIVVAVPTPQMRVVFHWQGESVPVIIPPTYVSFTPRTENTRAVIDEWLAREGYSVAPLQLPLKTLAVCSSLAEYGRNNICYVPGMGSFLQLAGAFSDLPCNDDPWRGPKELDRCRSCVACLRLCPTGAITRERFLLHTERCLTYHNKAAGDFPDWINPAWHHCLVGCMRCQTVCPENKTCVQWTEGRGEFSERETALLIDGVPLDQLPTLTLNKVKRLEINEDYGLLCRNLRMVICTGS